MSFIPKQVLCNLPIGKLTTNYLNEDNLNNANNKSLDERNQECISTFDVIYFPSKPLSEFRFMDECDFAACTKIILDSL